MGICSSRPPPRDYEPEPEPAQPPESPTWKLPVFPAPALPPLTRQNKIIIASSRYCEDEEEKIKTKKCVLNGMGEALSIVFGASVRGQSLARSCSLSPPFRGVARSRATSTHTCIDAGVFIRQTRATCSRSSYPR